MKSAGNFLSTAIPHDSFQNIHSLMDFQRHTARHVSDLRASGLPEVLTVNGKAELVVRNAEAYQDLLYRIEMLESAQKINRGLRSIREGQVRDFSEFEAEMRNKLR